MTAKNGLGILCRSYKDSGLLIDGLISFLLFGEIMSLALLLFLAAIAVGEREEIAVQISCPVGGSRCKTLSLCLSNLTACFHANTNLNFTEPSYEITAVTEDFFVVQDVSNLTLSGNNSTIQCSTRAGFAFINVTNLRIQGLRFMACGKTMTTEMQSRIHLTSFQNSSFFMMEGIRVALLLAEINDITLHETVVHRSYGYGVLIANSRWITISNSEFSYNNFQALKCYPQKILNVSCCRELSALDSSTASYESSCYGGNIVLINTDQSPFTFPYTSTLIYNTTITHGVNLDTQIVFDKDYVYAAGGLSLFIGHSNYTEQVDIKYCSIDSNIGQSSGNAVFYVHDNANSSYYVTVYKTLLTNGNEGFEHFSKTAQSGGLTIIYGFIDDKQVEDYSQPPYLDYKNILIWDSIFSGNKAFTAAALLFDSYIVRNKKMRANFDIINCTFRDNFGYDSIVSVYSNTGNRVYDVVSLMQDVRLIGNRLLNQPTINDRLIAYRHQPHISTMHIQGIRTVTFHDLQIQNNELRGISIVQLLRVIFTGIRNIISDNRGTEGGGMKLIDAQIELQNHGSMLYIENNRASLSGGGLYVFVPTTRSYSFCFFNIYTYQCEGLPPQLHNRIIFRNNSALTSGNSIYGGNIDQCEILECDSDEVTGYTIFQQLVVIPWENSLTEISSDIQQLCFCVDDIPECDLMTQSVSTYPGGKIGVSVVAVGQLNGTHPSIVLSDVTEGARIAPSEETQSVGVHCTNFNYTIHSLEGEEFTIRLSVSLGSFINQKTVRVSTEKCHSGFELDKASLVCDCSSFFSYHGVSCSHMSNSFTIPNGVWLGYGTAKNEFLVHHNCPLFKCNSTSATTVNLDTLDSQCKEGYFGIMCSTCQVNYSSVLGSNRCKKCSSWYSLLVIAIFIAAGPLLISAMLYGELSVANGIFNGAILYVNIVYIHRSLFFPLNHPNIVTVLIAWLNLDLGIEMCFYDGMDAYAKAWLQYLFPTYAMILTLFLAFVSWYFSFGAKVIGNNIFNVLATVILLCYSKCLRIIAETLSYTTLTSSLGYTKKVWLYDGSVPFMDSKHLALSIASLILLTFFIIPFTSLLLFEYPLLRSKIGRVMAKLRLHSFIAIYQNPYKFPFRWWTGIALVARALFVFAFQFNILGNLRLNLLIIVSLGILVLGSMWNFGTFYHNRVCMLLETFYIVNMVLLAGWSEYVAKSSHSTRNQHIVTYIFVSLALVVFVISIIWCIGYNIAVKKSIGKLSTVFKKVRCIFQKQSAKDENVPTLRQLSSSEDENMPPTTTYISFTDKSQKPLSASHHGTS